MKKILLFEGAGCVPRGDVENCRIRTAFTNDEGKRIYLEITGSETTKHTPEHLKEYTNAAHVWHCFQCTDETPNDDCNLHRLRDPKGKAFERYNFEYSRAGILEFVNKNLHCSFEAIEVCDGYEPGAYRVHGDKHGIRNLMEEYKRNA